MIGFSANIYMFREFSIGLRWWTDSNMSSIDATDDAWYVVFRLKPVYNLQIILSMMTEIWEQLTIAKDFHLSYETYPSFTRERCSSVVGNLTNLSLRYSFIQRTTSLTDRLTEGCDIEAISSLPIAV